MRDAEHLKALEVLRLSAISLIIGKQRLKPRLNKVNLRGGSHAIYVCR